MRRTSSSVARVGGSVTPFAVSLVVALAGAPTPASAQQLRYDREYPAIRYSTAPRTDRVADVVRAVREGDLVLRHDGETGYLVDLLDALDVPVASQALVFTGTSFQGNLITPERPRAVYFNDDTYVAWVPGSDVLEISAVDPVKGAVFYTLGQSAGEPGAFAEESDLCLQCHDSYGLTGGGAPRYLVGSMLPDENGQALTHEGWRLTDDRTPLRARWGGWYVTGTHGDLLHRGNVIVPPGTPPADIDLAAYGNRSELPGHVEAEVYPVPHSDIVALMVLEHQVRVQNAITRVGYDVRGALYRDETEGRPRAPGEERASAETLGVVAEAVEPLVEALLFVDEAPLGDRVEGTSGFAEEFSARGPRDRRGRSLRDFDLQRRTFRWPLSYMIHSDPFDGLPLEARRAVVRRVIDVLSGRAASGRFAHLGEAERRAALEILRDTEPELLSDPG